MLCAAKRQVLVLGIWDKPISPNQSKGFPMPDPQTIVVQSDPIVEDTPADKSGESLVDKQKEVDVEKTSSATAGRKTPS